MSTVRVTIDAGICGLLTEVIAASDDEQMVKFSVTSPCENIQRIAECLPEVNAIEEIGDGYEGEVYLAVRASLRHCCSGCVVPASIFKAMQVAANLALPKDITITFEKIAE